MMKMPYTAEIEPDWVVGYEIVDGQMVAMRRNAVVTAGLDEVAAGRVVPHDAVMRTMRAKLAHKSAA